jgi:hypothetical protein
MNSLNTRESEDVKVTELYESSITSEVGRERTFNHHQGVSMPLERPFVYVFKFPFHTNVFMLKLSITSEVGGFDFSALVNAKYVKICIFVCTGHF